MENIDRHFGLYDQGLNLLMIYLTNHIRHSATKEI